MAKGYDHIEDLESMRALVLKRDKIIAEREQNACLEEKALLEEKIKELKEIQKKYTFLKKETTKLLEDV